MPVLHSDRRFSPACAERARALAQKKITNGSSPRVRGTLPASPQRPWRGRFIPARAGNAASARDPNRVQRRFTPACARNATLSIVEQSSHCGSSPRERGTQGHHCLLREHRRFIPACAGNTAGCRSCMPPTPVQPRVCGEHRYDQILIHFVSRFIPACAGNTLIQASQARRRPVHPRVCGEHASTWYRDYISGGSSPRVRGTRSRAQGNTCSCRFTPACAGNALSGRSAACAPSVHPRGCGERMIPITQIKERRGSSPRLRVTRRM